MQVRFQRQKCPQCGHSPTLYQECTAFCGGAYARPGWIDRWEDDAINFAPGQSLKRCTRCWGAGVEAWCPECGCDLNRHELHQQRKRENS